jgi:hypothetical protein
LMSRRRIPDVPPELIFPDWRWEGIRLAARYLGLGDRAVDWAWEHSELSLDRNCAELLRDDRFNAYFGVEHGALSSMRVAHAAGKKTAVGFLSPHHATYAEWVDIEYDRFPELSTPDVRKLRRSQRRGSVYGGYRALRFDGNSAVPHSRGVGHL